jgi:hypothetical protein
MMATAAPSRRPPTLEPAMPPSVPGSSCAAASGSTANVTAAPVAGSVVVTRIRAGYSAPVAGLRHRSVTSHVNAARVVAPARSTQVKVDAGSAPPSRSRSR